jgi:hypothetical protein
LGLRNFFRRSNPEPTAPMAAAQLSPEMLRGEGIGELRFVFMDTGYWLVVTGHWSLATGDMGCRIP